MNEQKLGLSLMHRLEDFQAELERIGMRRAISSGNGYYPLPSEVPVYADLLTKEMLVLTVQAVLIIPHTLVEFFQRLGE